MLYTIKQPDFVHSDGRGTLTQLFREGFRQVNVIFSKKETLRGGHFHKQNTEAFYIISGSGEVNLTLDGKKECYRFSPDSYFEIQPNIEHSFQFYEDTLLVSMYSNGVELKDGEKDIYCNSVTSKR